MTERRGACLLDALGHRTEMTYNARGQVLTQRDARGNTTNNTYDARGNLLTTTDAEGATTTNTYDGTGNLLSITDALGRVTRYAYDRFGNLTSETDAADHVVSYAYDANGNRSSQTTTRTVEGAVETLVTTFSFDAENRLVRTVHPDGTSSETDYNSIGKPAVQRDALGRETRFAYDDPGRLTRTTHADGLFEETVYDEEGRRVESRDRAGRVTEYAYDAAGRLTQTTHPDGASRHTEYDGAGRVSREVDESGNATEFTYDAAGRRTGVTDPLGHTTLSAFDPNGNLTSVTDAKGRVTRFEYDAQNRRVRTVFPDGHTRVTGYDLLGRRTSETDEAGRTTTYSYDDLGRLNGVTDALGQLTRYAYDEQGNQVSQTDANGHTTTFAYDALGRRIKRTLPLGMFEAMMYDAAGNLAAKTDFNGMTTTYTYDVLNRLVSRTPDSKLAEPAVEFTYTASGQRATMVDGTGMTTYAYDDRDRLIEKATPQGTLFYTYDAAGNVTSIRSSNPGGTDVAYTWDTNHRLQDVVDAHAGTFSYSYDEVGNVAGWTYPNGVVSASTYDARNRLQELSYTRNGLTVASYAYDVMETGHRTRVVEHSGRTVEYGYDDLYRLKSEKVSGEPNGVNGLVTYAYDAVGNRLSRESSLGPVGDQAFTYDANDRLVGSNGGNGEQYDLNGNVIQDLEGNTFAWDSENRLISKNGNEVALAYDGDGNRVGKVVRGVTTRYLTDHKNPTKYTQVLEELQTDAVLGLGVYGKGPLVQSIAGEVTHLLPDGLGSIRIAMAAGNVSATQAFDAYGIVVHAGGRPLTRQFLGERFDPDIHSLELRARDYSTWLGRFFSRDPLLGRRGAPASHHGYAYANGDPVNLEDRSGLMTLPQLMATVAIVGGLGAFLWTTASIAIPSNRGKKLYVDSRMFDVDHICVGINPPYNNTCVPQAKDVVWNGVFAKVQSHFQKAGVKVVRGSSSRRPTIKYSPLSSTTARGKREFGHTWTVWGTVFLGSFSDLSHEAPFTSTAGLVNALANATSHEGLHALANVDDITSVNDPLNPDADPRDLMITYTNVSGAANQVRMMELDRGIITGLSTLLNRKP